MVVNSSVRTSLHFTEKYFTFILLDPMSPLGMSDFSREELNKELRNKPTEVEHYSDFNRKEVFLGMKSHLTMAKSVNSSESTDVSLCCLLIFVKLHVM